jgi:hypothetical protein
MCELCANEGRNLLGMTDAAPQEPPQDRPQMTHRSFYMRTDDVEGLAALVDDLHHTYRQPRYEVFSAALHVLRAHRTEIIENLTRNSRPVSAPVRTVLPDGS